MKSISIIVFLLLTSCKTIEQQNKTTFTAKINANADSVIFRNGLWFNGNFKVPSFSAKDVYTQNGIFVNEKPKDAKVVDLKGLYIIPPFGESHNHTVDSAWTIKQADKHLSQGIFYYKNPNNLSSVANPNKSYWDRPETLDVSFAHGGISIIGGHPDRLYHSLQKNYGMKYDKIDGDAFFSAPDINSLNEKWPIILKGKPDFIKLYLLNHNTKDSEGLSKEVFQAAVKLAKDAGLRTTVHLESVDDLQLAVDSGANESAHLVSRKVKTAIFSDGIIPDSLLDKIAEQGFITVTTTLITTEQYAAKPKTLADIQKIQSKNLMNLKAIGAPIAIGTDSYISTTIDEAHNLRKLNAFTDQEIIQLLIESPQLSIFPQRAIGHLKAGYEASFLGLSCDPFMEFNCIKKIKDMYKQGINIKP